MAGQDEVAYNKAPWNVAPSCVCLNIPHLAMHLHQRLLCSIHVVANT
jgi:hypothetical protein